MNNKAQLTLLQWGVGSLAIVMVIAAFFVIRNVLVFLYFFVGFILLVAFWLVLARRETSER